LFKTKEFVDAVAVIKIISDYVSTVRHRIRDVLADQPTLDQVRDAKRQVLDTLSELEQVVAS
jgi:hypothetical protein